MPTKTHNLEMEHFIFFLDQPHHVSLLSSSSFNLVEDWKEQQGLFINLGDFLSHRLKTTSVFTLSLYPRPRTESIKFVINFLFEIRLNQHL